MFGKRGGVGTQRAAPEIPSSSAPGCRSRTLAVRPPQPATVCIHVHVLRHTSEQVGGALLLAHAKWRSGPQAPLSSAHSSMSSHAARRLRGDLSRRRKDATVLSANVRTREEGGVAAAVVCDGALIDVAARCCGGWLKGNARSPAVHLVVHARGVERSPQPPLSSGTR